MSSRLVKSLNASSIARAVVSAAKRAGAACQRSEQPGPPSETRGRGGAGRRTLVHDQKVALPPQVHVAHARKKEAGDCVLQRRCRCRVSAWTVPARSRLRASSAMMATSDPSAWRFAAPSAAAICGCRCCCASTAKPQCGDGPGRDGAVVRKDVPARRACVCAAPSACTGQVATRGAESRAGACAGTASDTRSPYAACSTSVRHGGVRCSRRRAGQ